MWGGGGGGGGGGGIPFNINTLNPILMGFNGALIARFFRDTTRLVGVKKGRKAPVKRL